MLGWVVGSGDRAVVVLDWVVDGGIGAVVVLRCVAVACRPLGVIGVCAKSGAAPISTAVIATPFKSRSIANSPCLAEPAYDNSPDEAAQMSLRRAGDYCEAARV